MFLFKVIASKRHPGSHPGTIVDAFHESLGFPTREQAAAFARGLAESGRCDGVEIKQYIEVTDEAPRYDAGQVLEAIERALRKHYAEASFGVCNDPELFTKAILAELAK